MSYGFFIKRLVGLTYFTSQSESGGGMFPNEVVKFISVGLCNAITVNVLGKYRDQYQSPKRREGRWFVL